MLSNGRWDLIRRLKIKDKRLIIPVHCKRMQGIALCYWERVCRISVFLRRRKRHNVGIHPYETEYLLITCFIWLSDFGGNYENIFWRGNNVMTVHVGTEEHDVDRKIWEIPVIRWTLAGPTWTDGPHNLFKSLFGDLPDCFLEQWLRLTCGHLACICTWVRLPTVTSGVWHVCLFWCFAHELQGQRRE